MSTGSPEPQIVSLPGITIHALAKMIDHSLLHPTLTDSAMDAGLALSVAYNVATACVKPSHVATAVKFLSSTQTTQPHSVLVCPVVGFPHGTSLPSTKCAEAAELINITGPGAEIDVVINTGKVLSGEWEYIQNEIKSVNDTVISKGCTLKVIFENDYYMSLPDSGSNQHSSCTAIISRLCEICCDLGVAFTKTSTGYGFVKDPKTGTYGYVGARMQDLRLMVGICSPRGVQVKAAGGVRTLDDLLRVRAVGVTRVGATATKEILDEARRRGIPEGPEGGVTVEVDVAREIGGGY